MSDLVFLRHGSSNNIHDIRITKLNIFLFSVGQYLTEEEIQAQVDKSDLKFSTILIRHMDILDENARFARDKDKEVP